MANANVHHLELGIKRKLAHPVVQTLILSKMAPLSGEPPRISCCREYSPRG